MKKRKWMSFAVVLLMTSVVMIPATIGLHLKEIEIKNNEGQYENNEEKSSTQYKLVVNLEKIEYDRFEVVDGENYAIYDVEYTIENIGDRFYRGNPLRELCDPEIPWHVFADWYEVHSMLLLKGARKFHMLFPNTNKKSFYNEIKIKTDEIPDICDERFFAGNLIKLEVFNAESYPDNPDSNIRLVKYWNDNSDYEPTLAHLLVSTPFKLETNFVNIDNENLWYVKLIKNFGLPNVIENERLGWVNDVIFYLSKMMDDVEVIFTECNDSILLTSWNHLKPLEMWMISLGDWFVELLSDTCKSDGLNGIFESFKSIVDFNLSALESVSCCEDLIMDAKDFYKWIEIEPWENSIRVKGKVEGLEKDEILDISCDDKTFTFRDEDDGIVDNTIFYEFYLPNNQLIINGSYFNPINCNLTYKGSKHEKIIESQKMLSYCFSDGIFVKNIDDIDWKECEKEKSSFSKYPLISKIFDYLEKLPIINFIKNLNIRTQNQNIQTQEVIYEEYYTGAPTYDLQKVFYQPGEVVVKFFECIDVTNLEKFFECDIIDIIPGINVALLDVSERNENILEVIDLLCAYPEVEYAELNIVSFVPYDPSMSYTPPPGDDDNNWPYVNLNCYDAWNITHGNSDIDIAILDSGISDHDDIKKPASQKDFVNDDNLAEDDVGHGTAVTGLIMAWHNGYGINGIAPDCSYHALKVSYYAGSDKPGGNVDSFALADAIEYAAKEPRPLLHVEGLDAEVICCPVTSTDNSNKVIRAIENACDFARDEGSIIIAAAHDTSTDTIGEPASFANVICVGSVDNNNDHCDFSPVTTWGKPDVVAPGGPNIYTTTYDPKDPNNPDKKYGTPLPGNSWATAFVAGIAALYFSYKITNEKVDFESALFTGCRDLGEDGKDKYFGWGIVDAFNVTTGRNNLVADFTWGPESPNIDSKYFFDKSYDPDGEIIKTYWKLDEDDSWVQVPIGGSWSCEGVPNGIHETTVKVISDDGGVATATENITISKIRSHLV